MIDNNRNRRLGLRIQLLRVAGNQAQHELAERAGISLKQLGELERGRGILTVSHAADAKSHIAIRADKLRVAATAFKEDFAR